MMDMDIIIFFLLLNLLNGRLKMQPAFYFLFEETLNASIPN